MQAQKVMIEENKDLKEELFIAKGSKRNRGEIDFVSIYKRLENIQTAIKSLSEGK